MNILLVDDDKVDRALVLRALRKSNLSTTVTEAENVDRALELYSKNDYDIVLLDYRMPQRDGRDLLIELKGKPNQSSIAIVMMSSLEDQSLALECIEIGAQDFLIKSEISEINLQRSLLHASTRFDLEKELHDTYKKVKLIAETDYLTGLPNRYFFEKSLKLLIDNSSSCQTKIALLLLDLDNFKLINDTFGHDSGDCLLKKVVARIRKCLREGELLARIGGDEFALVISDLEKYDQAGLVARRIITAMNRPFKISDTSINTTVSIGISLYPDNGVDCDKLLKYADIAMYRAKSYGRNEICFFESEMQEHLNNRLKLEADINTAIINSEFILYYQAIVNPNKNSLIGFEALIRWEKDGMIILPTDFIPIAEETKQIVEIGFWIIDEAISTIASWNKGRDVPLRMAINFSAVQLSQYEVVKYLKGCLYRYNVQADLIDIEITETAFIKDTELIRNVIKGISDLGCKLALDDFGTGYSSISHLRDYPISILKIDKSIMPSKDGKKDLVLLEGLAAMGSILGMRIVAEGVESEYQKDLCCSLNIGTVQGYYFTKPMPKNEIGDMLLNFDFFISTNNVIK